MNDKIKHVFKGRMELTAAEREELGAEVRRFLDSQERQRLLEKNETGRVITRLHTGPMSSACPCCGRT
jgi:hypothetical protein